MTRLNDAARACLFGGALFTAGITAHADRVRRSA